MKLTPDGARYVAMADRRVARPFHYRWLIPLACGRDPKAWLFVQRVSLALLPLAGFWYAGGGWAGLFVAAVPFGLAGVWKFNAAYPVLVDAPAMVGALLAAAAWRADLYAAAVALTLVAGCVKESAPVFAALYAWNPVMLVGLIPVGIRHLQRAGPDVLDAHNRWCLDHPWKASRKYHRGRWLDPDLWVWPWGACLLAAVGPTWQVAAVTAVAYAQTLIATDTVRLYQWAWPVLAIHAAGVVPTSWLLVLTIVHVANPRAGNGL